MYYKILMAYPQQKRSVDFINSNLANFGTDLEYQVKLTAAQSEAAWYSILGDDAPDLKIWRIERFHVKDWPRELYGKFHTGDCYIILKRNGVAPKFSYDVHFWLGTESTIDERGTAAYKTAELDTFLLGAPVEYKEEQGAESALFKSYFSHLEYLPGGIESGFRHVDSAEYKVWTPKEYLLGEVKVKDCGETIYVYEDSECAISDRLAASTLVFSLRNVRPDIEVRHVDRELR